MLYLKITIILHGHSDSRLWEIENLVFLNRVSTLGSENNLEFACFFCDEISASVLISESMTADNDWLFPLGNQERNVFAQDWFTENSSIQVITDGSVRRFPHLFQVEFFHTGFIRCNCGAFDTNLK